MENNNSDEILKVFVIILLIVAIWNLISTIYKIRKVQTESNYSPVEYANYPNLTGNPVADIAILNQAGFRYDH